MSEAPLPGILADAECMRQAQLADLAQCLGARPGGGELRVTTLLDARLPLDTPAGIETQVVRRGAFQQVLRQELRRSDAVWLTAPESDDLLATLSQQVLASGCRLLGSDVASVRLCASKLQCSHWLALHGVASVPTLDDPRAWGGSALAGGGVVAKPDDGVGCEGQRRFDTPAEAWAWGRAQPGARMAYQPWVFGVPLSLSLLCARGRARLLSVNRQWVAEQGGELRLRGVTVGAQVDHDGSLARLADGVAQALPGLWGHVGIDLMLGPGGPVVLEVNPRATLSYAGLREALGLNPACALLELPRLPALVPARASRAVRVELGDDAASA